MQLHMQDSHTDRAVNAVRRASPFALIHDDGAHSYEGALADVDLYSPLVMEGGVLSLMAFMGTKQCSTPYKHSSQSIPSGT